MPAKKKAAKKRTTLASALGKKLYAVRDKVGEFVDIQSFKRAHGSDVKRVSKAEIVARKKQGSRRARHTSPMRAKSR